MESPSMLAPTANVVRPSTSFVHRYYLLLKTHYFLFFSAFGMLYPIINITLRSRGLSNTELSYINIAIPFLVFFTNPLSGFIADHSRRYLFTFNFVVFLVTILYSIMFILPTIKTRNIHANLIYDDQSGYVLDFCASQEIATKCASRSQCGCSYQANCTIINEKFYSKNELFLKFSMNSKNIYKQVDGVRDLSASSTCGIQYHVPIDDALEEYEESHNSNLFSSASSLSPLAICEITCSIAHYCHGSRYANQMYLIPLYSLLYVIGTNFLSNAIPLGASIGFATLHRSNLFGRQRVFGTIGFGISAFAASLLYKAFQTEYVYIIMFSITTIICIIVTSFIKILPTKQTEREMDDLSPKTKKQSEKNSQFKIATLVLLLKQIDVIVFLSLSFIWGMSYAVLDPYLYLYVDEIAACQSHSIIGIMSLVSAISEVTALSFASKILQFLGTSIASISILLAFAIRFSGYYFIRQAYYFTFMETMHFFNFGILYVLVAQKADSIAPTGLSGTLQGVALGVCFGLGRGIGLVVSSFIYTLLRPRLLFLIFALFNLGSAVIFGIYFLTHRERPNESIENENNANEQQENLNEEPLLTSTTKIQS